MRCFIAVDLPEKIKENQELISFHSVSKGMYGECGLRGGYMELKNIEDKARMEVLKLQSIQLCSSTIG